jgi:hypothetical protein
MAVALAYVRSKTATSPEATFSVAKTKRKEKSPGGVSNQGV